LGGRERGKACSLVSNRNESREGADSARLGSVIRMKTFRSSPGGH
ncbi:hypothetical protein chiPu_0020515, partial [Chiloscyllium punctatum]|nr:hypothetical protein [Chiloscyllium punctatum]